MSQTAVLDCLSRLEARTIASSGDGREIRQIGPFLAVTHPTNELIWLSYALLLPDAAETDVTAQAIEALRSHFCDKRRILRFEILEPLWPWAGPRLEALGLTLQGRMPLMICLPGQVRAVPIPAGSERVPVALQALSPTDPDSIFREYLLVARESFGQTPASPPEQEIPEQREHVSLGRYTCAYLTWGRGIAGIGAICTGNDELVGVAVRPAYRRRGIAAAVSSHLVTDHLEQGAAAVWLSAGAAAAATLYEKFGFQHAGEQLNYIDEQA